MYPSDSHEMKNYHKMVLMHTRLYILHNLRPSEIIWSSLMAKEVLSADMVEEIKANATNTQQVAALLDVLPARGPGAFDAFCDTLLECDHVHVAEHLKMVEATDQFREEIKRHAGSDMTDNQVDKFVASFKRTTPAMARFAERKFEVLLEEREDEINTKEAEIQKLDATNTKLRLEVDQVNSFLDSFSNVSKTISEEVQQQVPSKHFLNEEITQLQNLRKQVDKCNGNELASGYYSNMETIVKYIEQHTDTVIAASVRSTKVPREKSCIRLDLGLDVTLMEKMQNLVSSVSGFIDDVGQYASVPTDTLRTELQKVHTHAQNMADDLTLVNRKFQAILKQKKKVETEVFSLLHNLKETRRLEREIKEKRTHITELNKQGQLVRKKARSHRKELEQIQLNLTQKKLQLGEVQKALENQLQSADVRMHLLLRLLPDDGETDSNADTESLGTSTPCTEDFRSLSGSLPRMKQNGETYTLKSPTAHKPLSTTPRATAITAEDAAKPVPKPANSSDGVQGEGDKENKAEVNTRVGQPYRNRLAAPRQRPARPVATVSKPQLVMKVEGDKIQTGTSTAVSTQSRTTAVSTQGKPTAASADKPKPQLHTNKVAVVVEDDTADTDSAQRAAKRQHESSPDSDSQPSSADSSKPKWPLHHTGAPVAKKSPRKQDQEAESADSESSSDEEEVKTEKEKPQLVTKTVNGTTQQQQQGRYQYVLKSNTGCTSSNTGRTSSNTGRTGTVSPSKVPMGLSRDEYWQWVRSKQTSQTSPMTIGALNTPTTREIPASSMPIAREIPASSMPIAREIPASMPSMVFRQTSHTTPSRNDDRDPTNKQRSNLREAFATKRVEPCFKLPTNGR